MSEINLHALGHFTPMARRRSTERARARAGSVYLKAKRIIDVAGALVLLLLLVPALIFIVLLVKMTSRGPVLYRQDRLTREGKVFRMLKFRSMIDGAETHLVDGGLKDRYIEGGYKLPDGVETRLTRIGGAMRRSSLDELPQLWNVVRGEMSLVGPRPVVPDEISLYGDLQHCYLDVPPGLTGLWQVSGRSTIGYPQRCYLDRDYYEGRSLLLDLRILARTPGVVVRRIGAH